MRADSKDGTLVMSDNEHCHLYKSKLYRQAFLVIEYKTVQERAN